MTVEETYTAVVRGVTSHNPLNASVYPGIPYFQGLPQRYLRKDGDGDTVHLYTTELNPETVADEKKAETYPNGGKVYYRGVLNSEKQALPNLYEVAYDITP